MGIIYVVGLGPGDPGTITMAGLAAMRDARTLLLRTAIHPTVQFLEEQKIAYRSFDWVYNESTSFDDVYKKIVDLILTEADKGDVVYAVPGSPVVAERTVSMLVAAGRERQLSVQVLPGMSFLEILYTRLGLDPVNGVLIIDSKDVDTLPLEVSMPVIVTQVYNRQIASDVKLALMERYGDEYKATLVYHVSLPEEELRSIRLFELDREDKIDHLTSLVLQKPTPPRMTPFTLAPLVDVVKTLRSDHGCPWDKLQTHSSLRRYLLEEVYEVLEAIDSKDVDGLREELGDVLLQIVFHCRLAEEKGYFTVQNVIQDIESKMIRRHPHVFNEITVENVAEVMVNWELLKQREKQATRRYVLDGVTKGLPALLQSLKLQEKAAKVGFDWQTMIPVWNKVTEEWREVQAAVAENDRDHVEEECGDLLFATVNLLRHLAVEPESALHRTNDKFRERFAFVEKQVLLSGRKWETFSLEELDAFWNKAKCDERAKKKPLN